MIAIGYGTQRHRYRRVSTTGTFRGSETSVDATVPISKQVRSGGHWNSNLSPIIAQQRREPGGSRRKPRRPGSKSILGR